MNNNKIKLKEGLILKGNIGTYIYVVGKKIEGTGYTQYSAKAYNLRNNAIYPIVLSEYNILELDQVTTIEYIAYKSRMDVCKEYDLLDDLIEEMF